MKIIFLSHTPRTSVFKVGSYHLSREFVQMGHEVLYVPSALSFFHFLNLPGLRDTDYRQLLRARMKTLHPVKDEDGVLNLTPFVWIPFQKGLFSNPEIPVKQSLTVNHIGKKLRSSGFDSADLVIQDRPGLFFMRKFIRCRRWVYRATDDYSSMKGGADASSIQALEKTICAYADHIIVTSAPLQKLFRKRYDVNAEIIRNGVDIAHFSATHKAPPEYSSFTRPLILYVGSLDDRFDLELLLETAAMNRDYHYVIIGPGSQRNIPGHVSNISALGPRPYDQVPAYMQHADIGILPLKLTEANHARSPMKMYEYGVSGLPVVSTSLEELMARDEEFVSFADSPQHFCEQIRLSLERREQLSSVARTRSSEFSWRSIADRILASVKPLPEDSND